MGLFDIFKKEKVKIDKKIHFHSKEEFADKLLDCAIKNKELPYFIVGFPNYEITFRDLNGVMRPNYYAVLQALYRKYEKNPSEQFLSDIQKAYETMASSKLPEHIFGANNPYGFNLQPVREYYEGRLVTKGCKITP